MQLEFHEFEKLLAQLTERAENYCWHGWHHARSDSPVYRKEPGEDIYIVGVRTVSPQTLIEVSLRLFYAAQWREHRKNPGFNPEKHFYWFKLNIIDPFGRTGRKNLCTLLRDKEEEGTDKILELFQKIQKIAVFHDAERKAAAMNSLEDALLLL